MKFICSQNLFGFAVFEDFEPIDYTFLGIHGNGIAQKDGYIYIADYKDVLKVKYPNEVVEKIHHDGWDNIHTVFFDSDSLLVASTANNTAYRDGEVILGFPGNHYHNSLIPYGQDYYLMGLRTPKTMLIYNKKEGKVEKEIHLPFLNNMHSPTHYKDDLFLVSDGDGVVLFNEEGKPIQKSPHMNWPRGIKVVDELAYVVDRSSLYEYDVANNEISRRVENPVHRSSFGAFFDLVVIN